MKFWEFEEEMQTTGPDFDPDLWSVRTMNADSWEGAVAKSQACEDATNDLDSAQTCWLYDGDEIRRFSVVVSMTVKIAQT